jgi:hypothetical protein
MVRHGLAWRADATVNTDDLLAKPKGDWMGAASVRSVAGRLREAEGFAFERLCAPYLNFLLGPSVQVTPQGPIDRAGGDFAQWAAEDQTPSLLVQCKGFRVLETEVGSDQLRQFSRSLKALRASTLRPCAYVVVHNRDLVDPADRAALDDAVQALVRDGVADQAMVWDRKQLLRRVMSKLFELVKEVARQQTDAVATRLQSLDGGPVEKRVPVSIGRIRFRSAMPPTLELDSPVLRDPVDELRNVEEDITFVLGGFGQGKTLALTRSALDQRGNVLLVPAARLTAATSNTADVIRAMRLHDEVAEMLRDAGLDELVELVRVAVEHLLQQQDGQPLTLIVDGLDEAPMAFIRNGVTSLLNTVAELRCQTVVSMRTEFWHSKEAEFAAGVHQLEQVARFATVSVIDLPLWTPALAAEHVRAVEASAAHRIRLEELAERVARPDASPFAALLLRPLFLSMALEVVAREPLTAQSRAELLLQWTTAKVMRDVMRPQMWGTEGRPGLRSAGEDVTQTIAEAQRIGRTAARLMVGTIEDVVVLLDSVPWERIRDSSDVDVRSSAALVMTQTLLTTRSTLPGMETRFAHRALQEFYLAWDRFKTGRSIEELPGEILDWYDEIKRSPLFN